jgi:hypothetical protein
MTETPIAVRLPGPSWPGRRSSAEYRRAAGRQESNTARFVRGFARPDGYNSSQVARGEGSAMLEVIARTQLWTGFTAVIAVLVLVLVL